MDPGGSACTPPVCMTEVELALLRASAIATPIPASDMVLGKNLERSWHDCAVILQE